MNERQTSRMVVVAALPLTTPGAAAPGDVDRARRATTAGHALAFVAASSIVLIRLPVFFGDRQLLAPITAVIFAASISWAIPRQRHVATVRGTALAFVYVAVVWLELIRGATNGVYGSLTSALADGTLYVLVTAFAVVLVTSAQDARDRDNRLVALALAPAVYCLVNALAQLAGMQGAAADAAATRSIATGGPASLLGYLGIHITRVQFPFADGVNSMGVIAGAGLAACAMLMTQARLRRLCFVGLAASAYCLLLGDNRTALFAAIGVALAFRFVKPAVRWASSAIPATVPALPLLTIGVLTLLNSGFAQSFSRGAGDDFVTGAGRVYIWRASWDTLLSHPSLDQIVGWGAYGHITSGLSQRYAYLFLGTPDPTAFTTHNLVIQTILDGGYVALAALTFAIWAACRQLGRHLRAEHHWPVAALIAALAVIVLNGGTEASPTYGTQEALVMTLLILGGAAGLASARVRSSPPARNSTRHG